MSASTNRLLLYSTGEDAYFVTYNILVLLRTLGYSKDRLFSDHRKLAYLVDFVSDQALVSLVTSPSEQRLSEKSQALLSATFMRGVQRRRLVANLLVALSKRKLVRLSSGPRVESYSVSLEERNDLYAFLRSKMFTPERNNVAKLKGWRLGYIRYETLLDKLFPSGVLKWAD